jgi:hypothetical protein
MAEFNGWMGDGKLLLETDDLVFRGASRLSIPLREVGRVEAKDGWLEVAHGGGVARFDLGDQAPKWANAIAHPRTRIDKLDVKQGSKVAVDGVADPSFFDELRQRAQLVMDWNDFGTSTGADVFDLVFLQADEPARLGHVAAMRQRIAQNGGIWVITPKGRPELGHDPLVAAAKAAGLIDTKTARFSDTHTALKLVIPRAQRSQTTAPRPASNR